MGERHSQLGVLISIYRCLWRKQKVFNSKHLSFIPAPKVWKLNSPNSRAAKNCHPGDPLRGRLPSRTPFPRNPHARAGDAISWAPPAPGGPRGRFRARRRVVMAAAGSAAVSGAGTPVAGPSGRDLFAEGLLEFLRPAVQQLDSHVHAVRWGRGRGRAETAAGTPVTLGGWWGAGQEQWGLCGNVPLASPINCFLLAGRAR